MVWCCSSASLFAFIALAPGDPFDELPLDPRISEDTVAALRARYGLDEPVAVRYGLWVRAVLGGELGFSVTYRSPDFIYTSSWSPGWSVSIADLNGDGRSDVFVYDGLPA